MIIEIFHSEPLQVATKLVCLDRDNTIMFDSGYMDESVKIDLNQELLQSLKKFSSFETSFCLVSNQSGIGRGILSIESVVNLNQKLAKVLTAHGINLTLSIFCQHAPFDFCDCRKPKPTMLTVARSLHESLSGEVSVMYGDKESDQESAISAGFDFIKSPLFA